MSREINSKKATFFLIGLYGGGGEKVVLDLAKGFSLQGYDTDLLLFSRKGFLENQIYEGINTIDLDVKRIFFSIFPIIKYLRRERPIFILGTSEHANIVLVLVKLFSRTKTKVFVRVGMRFSDLFKSYKKKRDRMIPFLIRILYPYADKIIANSQNVSLNMQEILKFKKDKIEVIYNSKFIDEIREKSKQGSWNFHDKFTILGVGRLEKQKDFATLIRVFALVKQQIDTQLIILGDGGQRKELEDLILKLNLKDVYLENFTDNPYFYMANSNVLVSTSLWEGFSNVLIEAGILGLPIIATDCGSGSRELLAPNSDFNKVLEKGSIEYTDNGILVAKGDIKKIHEVVLKLAKDEDLRIVYSEKIKERTEMFEIKKIIKKYKNLI